KDPAVTVRLLRIVNSSLYSFSTEIETVGRAITLLGTQQVHDLVLASARKRFFFANSRVCRAIETLTRFSSARRKFSVTSRTIFQRMNMG
ncbi:MAG: HDOD domain-containing protein, partial [Desulfobulbaceae bacterium]|nr:HDOD domain-containing protein [Desulfobulbaceae bacterium]